MKRRVFRLAAMADLHCKVASGGSFKEIFSHIGEDSDALVLCGDLIDCGLPEEAEILLKELSDLLRKIPVVAVFGNHEFECGKIDVVRKIFTDGGITILDGDACEIDGVGFAGVKGFCGGFGERVLEPWGESIIKQFVRQAIDEALKLEIGIRLSAVEDRSTRCFAALRTDRCDGRRRAAGNFSIPRLQPARRTPEPLPRDCSDSRSCPSRQSRGTDKQRGASLQRRDEIARKRGSDAPALSHSRVACESKNVDYGRLYARYRSKGYSLAELFAGKYTRNVVATPT